MPRLTQALTVQPVGLVGSWGGRAEGAGFEGVAELLEGFEGGFVADGGGAGGEEVVDGLFEGHIELIVSRWGGGYDPWQPMSENPEMEAPGGGRCGVGQGCFAAGKTAAAAAGEHAVASSTNL